MRSHWMDSTSSADIWRSTLEKVTENYDTRNAIKLKLREHFDGKIVRKDLTKKIKEGANVPVYMLEFLLGQYCSSDDDEIIEAGVQNVKRILADIFVRPDESQKVLSVLRTRGAYTVIDMVTVRLDIKKDAYMADFSNLGLTNVPIDDAYPEMYDRLLCGGIWCMVQLEYESMEEGKKNGFPIRINRLNPIQMPHIELADLKRGRKAFTKEEWIDLLLRSMRFSRACPLISKCSSVIGGITMASRSLTVQAWRRSIWRSSLISICTCRGCPRASSTGSPSRILSSSRHNVSVSWVPGVNDV